MAAGPGPRQPVAVQAHPEAVDVAGGGAGGGQLVGQTRIERLQRLRARRQQHVHVTPLWHAASVFGLPRQLIAVKHRDSLKRRGQRGGDGQAGHARPDHHGVSGRRSGR
ncbi:MAG: hypothetical protein BRC32_07285 [Actinobacteria bacterium QS_8_72_14]|nr:MAG: hypothetical protein BRC32_07285 [Actinobacteria bacterium QS_8_72_14]